MQHDYLQTPIEAIGREFSSKNLSSLKDAWKSLTSVLVDSGNLTLQDFPLELGKSQALYDHHQVQAGAGLGLTEHLQLDVWQKKLCGALGLFESLFKKAAVRQDRNACENLIVEMEKILSDLTDTIPAHLVFRGPTPTFYDPFEELGLSSNSSPADPQERIQDSKEGSTTVVQADSGDQSTTENVQQVVIEASAALNERGVEGVLFQVDSPSEAIPGIGPGLPLFIPREVAISAIADISERTPKPLDAHDSLSSHANKDVVGVMTNAQIVGNDLIVGGVLWDWNQPEKIQAIAANKGRLGMSVNALASGHCDKINDQPVWVVDRMKILGANILYSEKATFKKTRLISADGTDPETESEEFSIAASELSETDSMTVDSQQIVLELSNISSLIESYQERNERQVRSINNAIDALQEQVREIQAERSEKAQQIAAQAREEREVSQRQEMVSLIASAIAPLQQRLESIVSPARRAISISAGGAESDSLAPEIRDIIEREKRAAYLEGINQVSDGSASPLETSFAVLDRQYADRYRRGY